MKGWPGVEDVGEYWRFKCPKDHCYFSIRINSPDDNIDHRCPFKGTTTHGFGDTMGLVEEIWGFLDDEINVVKSVDATEEDKKAAGFRARAYCRTLVLFMQPIFQTDDEIAKESIRRWRARQIDLDVPYVTPGWLHSKFKTLMDGDVWYHAPDGGWTSDPAQAAGGTPAIDDDTVLRRFKGVIGEHKVTFKKVPPAKSYPAVDADTMRAIRTGAGGGFFTAAELASAYGLSEAHIWHIIDFEEK